MDNNQKDNTTKNSSNLPFIFRQSFLGSTLGAIIFLPLLVGYIYVKFFNHLDLSDLKTQFNVMIFIGIYAVIAAIYSFVISQLQLMERVISLYTSKDNVDSSPVIAKKILWDSIKFKLKIFLKYYSLAIIISLAVFGYGFSVVYNFAFADGDQNMTTAALKLIIVPVVFLFDWVYYHYFISAKLRYLWFSYINNYGEIDSIQKTFEEMNDLNTVSKGEMFKKALLTQIKNDSSVDVIRLGIGNSSNSIKTSNPLGEVTKDIAGGYSIGVTSDVAANNTLGTYFDLYKKAYGEFYKKDFIVNSKIYNI
jgi:uncharacterized membrane protein